MSNNSQPTPITYTVDREHDGLRLAIAGIFAISAVIGFVILAVVIPGGSVNLLALIGGVLLAAIFTNIVERQLKQRWPSGREIQLTDDAVTLLRHGNTQQQIEIDGEAQLLYWHFTISRRTRVPKGWRMVAVAVHNMADDLYISIYTLMSPEAFDALDPNERFVALKKTKDIDDKQMRLAGEQRRLHHAESVRWHDGAELPPTDFEAFLSQLEQRFYA